MKRTLLLLTWAICLHAQDRSFYWSYQTYNEPAAVGGGVGAVVNTGAGLTALFGLDPFTIPGPARAFRWNGSRMADVTTSVLPIWDIRVRTPGATAVADFDGDGRQDIFLATLGLDEFTALGGQSHLFIQSADARLIDETASRIPVQDAKTHSVTSADIDGDGDVDLFMGNICCAVNPDGSLLGPQLYINDGTGHFTATTDGLPAFVWKFGVAYSSSCFIDINNDAFPDLVLGGRSNNAVLLNDGHGTFLPAPVNTIPAKFGDAIWHTVFIGSADYDGDGFMDLMLSMTENYKDGIALQFLVNNGDGTFHDASSQVPQNFPPLDPEAIGQFIQRFVPCDLNADGWIDFVATANGSARNVLYINQGQGVFTNASAFLPSSVGAQVLAGDFDGDSKTDLFFKFGASSTYAFARNLQPILPASIPGPGVGLTTLAIQPAGQMFPAAGGSATIRVTAPASLSWAPSAPDWVKILEAPGQAGIGTLGYLVHENTGIQRTGTITVGNQIFTVDQASGLIATPPSPAWTLAPPAQDAVLRFEHSVAYTHQISLGAAFTMESWVFIDESNPFGSMVMGKPNNPRGATPFIHYALGFVRGLVPNFSQSTGQPNTFRTLDGPPELPLHVWTHMAAVLESSVMRLYVNGVLAASHTLLSAGPPAGAAVPFGLGGGTPDGSVICCEFSGAMREARVWSRALTAAELQMYAVQKLTGNEPGLIAAWALSEGSGLEAHAIGPQAAKLTFLGRAVSWANGRGPAVAAAATAGGASGIAQNGWIEIYGTNLTPLGIAAGGLSWGSAPEFASGKMPTQLAGVSVTVNGRPAFVAYVSPTQLNVLSPLDSMLGTARIVVTSGGLASAPFDVNVRAAAPSFPLYGSKYIVATHADNTLVGPVSLSVPGYPVTPAAPGETIVLWGFGFGLPTTALIKGSSTQFGQLPTSPVIQIGGAAATVVFAGVTGPGLYQFNVIVPGTAVDGDNPVTANYNGSTAPVGGVIAVKR